MIERKVCRSVVVAGLLLSGSAAGRARGEETTAQPQGMNEAQSLVHTVIENENAAAARQDHWEYLSSERSGRTGGHLWTERVVETTLGRVRLLIAGTGRR